MQLGNFSAGPDLAGPRGQNTATVLNDGRVLVTGGTDGTGILADSEVFDPLTNTWEIVRNIAPTPDDGLMMDPTAAFPTARQLATATKLNDGRILIAGGLGVERMDNTVTPPAPIFETMVSAYTFDQATNSFTAVGSLSTPRGWHEAGLDPGGSAVLIGGMDINLASISNGDVFDPTANAFTLTGGMLGFHTWGKAVSLSTGVMIVNGCDVAAAPAGGFGINGFPNPRNEVFSAGAWLPGPDNVGDRFFNAGNEMANGNAFFAGGREPQQQGTAVALVSVATTEMFDTATNAWVAGPAMTTPRFGAIVTSIGAQPTDNDQLIIGGLDDAGAILTDCEVWSAANMTIAGTVTMATPRSDFAAVTLGDGRILVVGGIDAAGVGIMLTEMHTR